jgi:hypothetical protein
VVTPSAPISTSPTHTLTAPTRRPVAFDPGWLFLVAGLALLSATLLIPAVDSLNEARWLRDRARVFEEHRLQRITRHDEFWAALREGDPTLALALAASQLNQITADRAPLEGDQLEQTAGGASVFPALEPDPIALPPKPVMDSTLHRLVTGEKSRSWILAIAGVMILIGLLPASVNPVRRVAH